MRCDSNTATVIGSRNMKIYTKFGRSIVSFVIDGCRVGIGVVVGSTVISCAADVVVMVVAVVVDLGAVVVDLGAVVVDLGAVVVNLGAFVVDLGAFVVDLGAGDVVVVVGGSVLGNWQKLTFPAMATILPLGHTVHSDEDSVLANASGGHTRHRPGPNPALYEPGGQARQTCPFIVYPGSRVQGSVPGPLECTTIPPSPKPL